MTNIIIAILQFLGVMASPDLLNNESFKKGHEAEFRRANEIYTTHQYRVNDGVVIVDGCNP